MAYQLTPLENILQVRAIPTLFYFSFANDYVSKWDRHDFWELIYVDHGTTVVRADDRTFPLEMGQVILHRPNVRHTISCDGTHKANVFIITFVCDSPALQRLGADPIPLPAEAYFLIVSLIKYGMQTFDCHDWLIPLENAPSGGQQMVRLCLEMLLIHLLRTTERQEDAEAPTVQPNASPLPADQIMAYLDERIYERVTIEQLCDAFHYQKSRLCALFKKQTGKTIITYFTERKIETAKELMRQGKSMGQIATMLQFDTPQYFSRIFRSYTGLSPRAYRSTLMFDVNNHVKKRQLNTPKTQEN